MGFLHFFSTADFRFVKKKALRHISFFLRHGLELTELNRF